jgi:Synergist-CTERM protein sorting domain-containing protein
MLRSLPALAIVLAPALAAAHVRITSPTPRSQDQLKQRHCGQTGSTRANIQMYKPGAPLHLVWDEYVVHPGWFRVSFQQNGDAFEIPPASNGVNGSGAVSNYPTEDLTGKTDSGTGSLIIADRIKHGTLSLDLTLPDVECDSCTLQLIQMMTDKPPYATDTTSDDIYFACVDLVLSASAPDHPPGEDGTASSGGCSAAGGPSALLALAALGLVRRRRQEPRLDDVGRGRR